MNATQKLNLTDRFVQTVKADPIRRVIYYDTACRGFALQVEPVTGNRTYKCKYTFANRSRTYNMGHVTSFASVKDARNFCFGLLNQVRGNADRKGIDPQAERVALRGDGTFASHVADYLVYKKDAKPKSVEQIASYLNPLMKTWGKLPSADIPHAEVLARFDRTTKRSPSVANMELAALSGFYTWLIKKKKITTPHPCHGIERNEMKARERVMNEDEIRAFWTALANVDPLQAKVLKMLLLSGQRSIEVRHMRREHIRHKTLTLPAVVLARLKAVGKPAPESVAGFLWKMPGEPSADWDHKTRVGTWPGTKGGTSHDVWLPPSLADLIGPEKEGFVFADKHGKPLLVQTLPLTMKAICKATGMPRTTPHDLRRTHGTTICTLGFSRDQMNRVQGHADGGIADVYDQHTYYPEFWEVMSAAIQHLTALEAPVGKSSLSAVS